MIFALVFVCTRISQIVTLIPPMGMLAWFVNQFVARNALTPDSILILFILTVLALAWAVSTLFSYHRSSANARFVALVDVAFAGALIAAVYQLRGIADADCGSAAPGAPSAWYAPAHVPVPDWGWQLDKPCSMLKASWAFAMMNIVFFAATALAAFSHGGDLGEVDGGGGFKAP
ncbi:NADH dehydrogenase subunit 5 [Epichloe bromicola]